MSELRKLDSKFNFGTLFLNFFRFGFGLGAFVLSFTMESNVVAVFIAPATLYFSFKMVLIWSCFREIEGAYTDLSMFFNHALTYLKSGYSYRRILREYSFTRSKIFVKNFQGLQSGVFFTQHFRPKTNDSTLDFYFLELFELSRDSFRIQDRLIFLQKRFNLENYLRHRSREKTILARVQVSFLSFLYFLVLIFNFQFDQNQKSLSILCFSLVLFSTGLISIHFIGRMSKCKFSNKSE